MLRHLPLYLELSVSKLLFNDRTEGCHSPNGAEIWYHGVPPPRNKSSLSFHITLTLGSYSHREQQSYIHYNN